MPEYQLKWDSKGGAIPALIKKGSSLMVQIKFGSHVTVILITNTYENSTYYRGDRAGWCLFK